MTGVAEQAGSATSGQGGTRPWIAHYPAGVPAEIDPARVTTLADMIRQSCRQNAEKPAFISFGKAVTYAELAQAADKVTAWLQSRGLRKGDRVAIMMPNVLAYPAVMFGILMGGYTVVNVNPLYTARELTHQLNDSGAKALFVLENFAHVVAEALPKLSLQAVVLTTPGDLMGLKGHIVNFVSRHVKKAVKPYDLPAAIAMGDVLATQARPAPVEVGLDDIAYLQYTGGTTGVSKGAVLTHRNVASNVVQAETWFGPMITTLKEQPVMVTALPLYHIFALTCCCLFMVRIGAACLLIANPRDIPGFIKILKGSRFHMMSGVNTLYNALANNPDIRSVDFSRLLLSISGGMATQAAVAKKWKDITGRAIIEGYGLSETAPVVSGNRPDLAEFSGTIGYPMPSTDIVIRDEAGQDVPTGEPGELCVRGPQVMPGYWQRPDETAKVMTADGYFRTGDIAVLQADGQVKIVDRMKDMILVSGFNVYPNEVEDVIATHPGVVESAVVGQPDPHSGESVVAYVVRKDMSLTADALRDFCRTSLTAYKVPRTIIFREELPKTNVGKVLRRALRDETAAG
jgi:long-chain acyl-CoA synthetase